MNLIILYGPPAVGKLSIGKILQKHLEYKLLHNHLTYDLASSIFDQDRNVLSDVNMKLRLLVIKEAAKHKLLGLIMTYLYASPKDDELVKLLYEQTKDITCQMPIQLTCTPEKLYERVISPSRLETNKIADPEILKSLINSYDLFREMPFFSGITIDNTSKSPTVVANEIIRHYNL